VTTRFSAAAPVANGEGPAAAVGCDVVDAAVAGDTDEELVGAEAAVVVAEG
jgi:hypothetical protein